MHVFLVECQQSFFSGVSIFSVEDVLPPFLFNSHISFGQSQALQTLTKFIYKNIKIYNNKSTTLDLLLNVLSHRIDLL